MNKSSCIEGTRETYFGVSIANKQAADLWKLWRQGDELYTLAKQSGVDVKISIHRSGQVHHHLGSGKKQLLAPGLFISEGRDWRHGLEVRFLLSKGALMPREASCKTRPILLDVELGQMAVFNILTSSSPSANISTIPQGFTDGASLLWKANLRDGSHAILIGRILPISEQGEITIFQLRKSREHGFRALHKPDIQQYMEMRHISWSPLGGNVISVVPMGTECFVSNSK